MSVSLIDRLLGRKPKTTATIAKERLTLVLAHERTGGLKPSAIADEDILKRMQEEILAVVSRYFPVDQSAIQVHLEKAENLEILEVNVVLTESPASRG